MANPLITANLIEWWELGEASGDRVGSKGSYNLTVTNDEGNVVGLVGNAVKMSGGGTSGTPTNAYLTIPNAAVSSLGEMSFACWVYPTAINAWSRLIDINRGASTALFVCYLNSTTGAISFGGETGNVTLPVGTMVVNTWHFVCGWGSLANKECGLFVYRDGIYAAASWRSGTNVSDPQAYTSGKTVSAAYIGRSAYSADGMFAGRFDSYGVWSRLLTMSDVVWLINSGSGRAYADLAGVTPTYPDLRLADSLVRTRPDNQPFSLVGGAAEDYLPAWGVLYPRYTPQKN